MISRLPILFIIFIQTLSIHVSNGQTPNSSDVASLKAIYNAFTNAPSKLAWDLSGNPYSWSHVQWENGRVIALNFGDKGLNGTLSSTIGNLTELRLLDLTRSSLSGSIPSSIGSLQDLVFLSFLDCGLSGELPASIYSLISLEYLNLGGNDLTGSISEGLGNLTSLVSLILNDNLFEGPLPESIGNLKSLTFLFCPNNMFTSIPSSIGDLGSLTIIDLSSNKIGEIPATISGLQSLTNLNLSFNSITDLPVEIGQLSSLMFLSLAGNQLSNLPESIGDLPTLLRLNLDSNELSYLPESFARLQKLSSLFLSDNNFETFPAQLTELKNLQFLYLNQNQLSEIVADIGKMEQLADLRLVANQFEVFPNTLGDLNNMVVLEMADNKMSGSIPLSIRNHPTLRRLGLENNDFSTLDDFHSPSLVRLIIVNNLLPFSELEKNLTYFAGPADYDPQRWTAEPDTLVVINDGESVTLDSEITGLYVYYTWYKDQNQINRFEPTIQLVVTDNVEGTYYCEVRNSRLAGSMISRKFIVVEQLKFESEPSLIESNLISLEWQATTNKNANVYYVIDQISLPLPSVEQIKNGLNVNNEVVPSGVDIFVKDIPNTVKASGISLGSSSRIVVYAEDENSLTSTDIFVIPVVVASLEVNDIVKIYPNPAHESLTLKTDKISSSVEIRDLSGRKVYEENLKTGETTIDISTWPVGFYVILIDMIAHKFMKY